MSVITLSQNMQALQKANEVRAAQVAVKHEIAAGTLSVADALVDERAGALTVFAVLMAQRRVGASKARRVLRFAQVGELRRVRELTDRQRVVLVEALDR